MLRMKDRSVSVMQLYQDPLEVRNSESESLAQFVIYLEAYKLNPELDSDLIYWTKRSSFCVAYKSDHC